MLFFIQVGQQGVYWVFYFELSFERVGKENRYRIFWNSFFRFLVCLFGKWGNIMGGRCGVVCIGFFLVQSFFYTFFFQFGIRRIFEGGLGRNLVQWVFRSYSGWVVEIFEAGGDGSFWFWLVLFDLRVLLEVNGLVI